MDKNFNQLEFDVMKKIINEDPAISEILMRQYSSAKVIKREFTGAGFFTDFEIADEDSRISEQFNATIGNTQARLEGLKHGAGFILFVKDGLIEMLEGYTNGNEPWPEKIGKYSLVD